MKRLLIIHDVLHYHVTMKVIVTTTTTKTSDTSKQFVGLLISELLLKPAYKVEIYDTCEQ